MRPLRGAAPGGDPRAVLTALQAAPLIAPLVAPPAALLTTLQPAPRRGAF